MLNFLLKNVEFSTNRSLDEASRQAALAHLRDRLSKVGRSELLGTFQTFDQNSDGVLSGA